jgi:hypothetical protein
MIAYLHILQENPRSPRLLVHLARHAGLAKEIVAVHGRAQQRRLEAHHRANGIHYENGGVQASAHEARMAEVNAVMDTVLKTWETSEDQSESKAAEYFKFWHKKTGEALTCCSSQCPVALWQALSFCASVICCAAVLRLSANIIENVHALRTISCKERNSCN